MSQRRAEPPNDLTKAINGIPAAGDVGGVASGEPVPAKIMSSDTPPITRNITATIRASLMELSQDSSAATWAPSEGALNNIFKHRRFTSLDGSAESQGDLGSVVMHDLTLQHVKSTFPVSVGANIFSVDSNTYSSSGTPYATIVPANVDRKVDNVLQKDPVSQAYGFANLYPGYTASNLETKGVHKVDMKRFVLLTADHPIVTAIHENSDRLQLGDVSWMPEGLIKVSSSLYETMLPMVKSQVASQIRVRDFSRANIHVAPAEHGSWGAVRELLVQEKMAPHDRELKMNIQNANGNKSLINECKANHAVLRQEVESAVDHTKHEVTFEIQTNYNFLSTGNGGDSEA